MLVEAKRIRRSSLQAHQLPRELTALIRQAGKRSRLLLPILGDPPPVAVAGRGRLPLHDALLADLGDVLARTPEVDWTVQTLAERLPEIVAWTTWDEIATLIRRQAELFRSAPDGLAGTVKRLNAAVTQTIEWHS